VQILIALVVTPEGLPLAYEVLPGNTADKTTLRGSLDGALPSFDRKPLRSFAVGNVGLSTR